MADELIEHPGLPVFSVEDEAYMRRALQLAEHARAGHHVGQWHMRPA